MTSYMQAVTKGSREQRQAFIREHYRLEAIPGGWRAVNLSLDKQRALDVISGPDRAAVCAEARCRWGHFNFEAEAEAFNEIFPRASVLGARL